MGGSAPQERDDGNGEDVEQEQRDRKGRYRGQCARDLKDKRSDGKTPMGWAERTITAIRSPCPSATGVIKDSQMKYQCRSCRFGGGDSERVEGERGVLASRHLPYFYVKADYATRKRPGGISGLSHVSPL